ncbi:MAG: hypothetical protein J6T12_01945 [Salinivirgaceae bacterium]|nr:hypothetical protein [Salinivirgaceae bacterium]
MKVIRLLILLGLLAILYSCGDSRDESTANRFLFFIGDTCIISYPTHPHRKDSIDIEKEKWDGINIGTIYKDEYLHYCQEDNIGEIHLYTPTTGMYLDIPEFIDICDVDSIVCETYWDIY